MPIKHNGLRKDISFLCSTEPKHARPQKRILSGFIFDINSMPDALQYLTLAIPARHFNTALQTVFLAGDIWPVFLPRMAFMLGLGAAFLVITYRKLVKRLDV